MGNNKFIILTSTKMHKITEFTRLMGGKLKLLMMFSHLWLIFLLPGVPGDISTSALKYKKLINKLVFR